MLNNKSFLASSYKTEKTFLVHGYGAVKLSFRLFKYTTTHLVPQDDLRTRSFLSNFIIARGLFTDVCTAMLCDYQSQACHLGYLL